MTMRVTFTGGASVTVSAATMTEGVAIAMDLVAGMPCSWLGPIVCVRELPAWEADVFEREELYS